jgi:hypothetical protein
MVSGRYKLCPKHREESKKARKKQSDRIYKINHRDELNAKRNARRALKRQQRAPTMKECCWCHKHFVVTSGIKGGVSGRSMFCSDDCRKEYKKDRRIKNRAKNNALPRARRAARGPIMKLCGRCKKPFAITSSANKFCPNCRKPRSKAQNLKADARYPAKKRLKAAA